jgi:hypothetical protein
VRRWRILQLPLMLDDLTPQQLAKLRRAVREELE